MCGAMCFSLGLSNFQVSSSFISMYLLGFNLSLYLQYLVINVGLIYSRFYNEIRTTITTFVPSINLTPLMTKAKSMPT